MMAATPMPTRSAPGPIRPNGTRSASSRFWSSPTARGGEPTIYGGPYLDRIEFIDLGTDPSALVSAADAEEIDMTYQTSGDFVEIFDGLGWEKSEAVTSATIAVRFNQDAELYKDVAVRRALQKAVDNSVVLELGYAGLGTPAENHHVCPIHPEYAELPPLVVDPAAAKAEIEAAGHGATEFELISIDDAWQSATCDAVAAQIRDAGINIKRTILPGSTFWNDWTKYPFSATEWNMRPLGVQVLALAYVSGAAWNETAFKNAEFDAALAKAMSIADVDERRDGDGRDRGHHAKRRRADPALLALDLPAYPRRREGRGHAPDLRDAPLQVVDRGLIEALGMRRVSSHPRPCEFNPGNRPLPRYRMLGALSASQRECPCSSS